MLCYQQWCVQRTDVFDRSTNTWLLTVNINYIRIRMYVNSVRDLLVYATFTQLMDGNGHRPAKRRTLFYNLTSNEMNIDHILMRH